MSLLGDLRVCGSYCSWLLDEQIGDIESLPASACARFSTNPIVLRICGIYKNPIWRLSRQPSR